MTVVTHRRNPILIRNIALLRESFRFSKTKYTYTIDAIVVLPDHFHMIITPDHAKEYPHIIRTIKQYFSKHCDPKYYENIDQSSSRWKEGYRPVWQKKYYEHTIRDARDLKNKTEYLLTNPIKHGHVNSIEQWPYSSYHYR